MIIFGRCIQEIDDWGKYERQLININENIAVSIMNNLNQN